MDIPVELFLGFIGTSIAIAIFGFIRQPQIPACLVIGGMFILTLAVSTDNIISGNIITSTHITEEIIGNSTVMHYQIESGTTNRTIADTAGQQKGMAEGSNSAVSMLNGDSIECVDIFIAKVGNPSIAVPIIVAFYTSTNTPILEIARVNVTQVTTTFNWIEGLCVPEGEEVTIQNGIKVGITYASGDATNFLRVKEDTSNPFDLTETTSYQLANGASSWVVVTSRDVNMRMYDNEQQIQINEIFTNEDNLYEFTEMPKVLFSLIGSIIMLVGGLMVMKD